MTTLHSPRVPEGERFYAIGDVHGRLDLFGTLVAAIRQDSVARGERPTTLVVLGNLIDIGPESAKLMQILSAWTRQSTRLVLLKGSHEEMMAEALGGDLGLMSIWLAKGGDRTLESWGVPVDILAEGSARKILTSARAHVPADMVDWLDRLPLIKQAGDYLFVHAGLRPGVPIDQQTPEDLLWIDDAFLDSTVDHGAMVVHGHAVAEDGPVVTGNRIGLNTAGFRTGRLTALGLQDDERWFLAT